MKVAPSILSVFNQNLDEILFQLAKADIKYLHLDVMDNKFVPNYNICLSNKTKDFFHFRYSFND